MPRTARVAPGGMVFHGLNRGVARMQLFEKAADYQAFEQVLRDTLDRSPMRICAYAVMPNHWHQLFCGRSAMASWRPSCNGCRSPMCVAGKNTGAMRDWAMSTKVDTSRSQWKATSISGLWPDTLSATRCAPISSSSCERRNGGGQACGNAVILREKSGRCWRRGRSICRRIGSSGSIKPTTRRNWKRFAGACNEAAPLASRNGRRKSRNVWASSRPIVPQVAREGWAEIKMPRPGEDRSDVGGAAQQYRTRPAFPALPDLSRFPRSIVPLSASMSDLSRFPLSLSRFPLSRPAPVPLSRSNSTSAGRA